MCPQIWVVKKTVSQDGWTRYELSDGTVINDMSRMFGSQMSTATPQPPSVKIPKRTPFSIHAQTSAKIYKHRTKGLSDGKYRTKEQ